MSKEYTIKEVNQVTELMKLIAKLEADYPILSNHTSSITDDLIYIRDFMVDMLDRQDDV